MSGWNYTTSTEEIEHGDVYPQEDKSEETRWCNACNAWEAESYECGKAAEALDAENDLRRAAGLTTKRTQEVKTKRQKLICSCGSHYCGAIVIFGLTVPTFEEAIQPIPSQFTRDQTALSIKAGGGL